MSKMELRTSRSRSKTPFATREFIEKDVSSGNHVEKTVVRTTRRTVFRTDESATSSTDEVNTSREIFQQSKPTTRRATTALKSEKTQSSLRNKVFKTSDYSSEDGENEVSSTAKTISQNEKNQIVEDARTLVNGSNMPAFELYKKSGRYWEVYPKTDWTYSPHSKDRVEIAPGVVAMPNMSRKTIHSLDESNTSLYSDNVSHKNINTENIFTSRYSGNVAEGVKRSLYSDDEINEYYIKRRSLTRWTSFKQWVTTIFTTIFTSIITSFYYSYSVQTKMFSYIHRFASKVMLLDTYLLWKSNPGNKTRRLILLCLIPLLIFGGLWLLSNLGTALYSAVSNYTLSGIWHVPNIPFWNHIDENKDTTIRTERDVDTSSYFEAENTVIEKKAENLDNDQTYLKLPSAGEIASSLSKDQIEAIALAVRNSLDLDINRSQINVDELVEKVVQNPSFVNVINNYYHTEKNQQSSSTDDFNADQLNKQKILIESLTKEIEKMKQDILLSNKLRQEDYARLSLDMKTCCNKKPIVNIEGYVSRIVTDLLNNPEFLENQRGLHDWLHTLFVAKQDLEYHLGNLTANMDSKIATLIEANSQVIMEQVSSKLLGLSKMQIDINSNKKTDLNVAHTMNDEHIRNIVKNVLAIYDADKTGLVDYAMETMGGQIVTTRCTEPYHYGKAVVSVLGIPLWYPVNSPRTVITPSIAPGECWAFQNFPGFVVIKLSNRIKVEAFSMEHISRLLIPEGKIDSAPKEFEIYGLKEENDREPVLLGSYKYDYNGEPLQFFLVDKDNQIFDMIEIRIISNHGNPNYTCLYRFRVHGKLHHEPGR